MTLEAAQKTSLFTWFSLDQVGEPEKSPAETLTRFQPSGPAFHDLVRLEVGTNAGGLIRALCLHLARRFIEDPAQGIFAADLAKSFLQAAVPTADRSLRDSLANEISGRARTNRPVIVAGGAPPSDPLTGPPSRAYRVYRGEVPQWSESTASTRLTLDQEAECLRMRVEKT